MRSWELKGIKQPARCACSLFRAGLFRWGACVGVLPSVHCVSHGRWFRGHRTLDLHM